MDGKTGVWTGTTGHPSVPLAIHRSIGPSVHRYIHRSIHGSFGHPRVFWPSHGHFWSIKQCHFWTIKQCHFWQKSSKPPLKWPTGEQEMSRKSHFFVIFGKIKRTTFLSRVIVLGFWPLRKVTFLTFLPFPFGRMGHFFPENHEKVVNLALFWEMSEKCKISTFRPFWLTESQTRVWDRKVPFSAF